MKKENTLPIKEKPKSRSGVLGIVNLLLVLFLVYKDYKNGMLAEPVMTRVDSLIVFKDSTVYRVPEVIQTVPIPYDRIQNNYIPDTNYNKLVEQYKTLALKYESLTVQTDTVKIDSIGTINILDTVATNKIIGRSVSYNLKYPDRTQYILMPPPPNLGQLYAGGGVGTLGVEGSLMYKTRKDHIYALSGGMTYDKRPIIGIKTYFKLSRR